MHETGPQTINSAGVIWITGYSGAGKTTVGRKVVNGLQKEGVQAIFLDGDDLRSIFASQWGYERENRIELAHVYFRLCSHLASQGSTVVISAVAMYDEIRTWFETFVPNSVIAYLRVPESERLKRDQDTKQIYGRLGNVANLYDEPDTANLIIDNHGTVSSDDAAEEIVNYFLKPLRKEGDKGRKSHWEEFYTGDAGCLDPSPFGLAVTPMLPDNSSILEVGCGNGRDSAHFSNQGHHVVALDTSEAAIELCRQTHKNTPVAFMAKSIGSFLSQHPAAYNAVYSRFVLHAMTFEEEAEFLTSSAQILPTGGKIFIECRSLKDPLSREGDVLSPTERVCGHYRRFIILDDLITKAVDAGFDIIGTQESTGLAVFGDEDPVVIWLFGERQ